MKNLVIASSLILVSLSFACKKSEINPTKSNLSIKDYDVANKVLRVYVKSSGTNFSVHLMQIRPGYANNPYREYKLRKAGV